MLLQEEAKPAAATKEDGKEAAGEDDTKIGLTPLDSFFADLPAAMSRELIDKAAVDFCYLNNKASRRRLIKVRAIMSYFCADIGIVDVLVGAHGEAGHDVVLWAAARDALAGVFGHSAGGVGGRGRGL